MMRQAAYLSKQNSMELANTTQATWVCAPFVEISQCYYQVNLLGILYRVLYQTHKEVLQTTLTANNELLWCIIICLLIVVNICRRKPYKHI